MQVYLGAHFNETKIVMFSYGLLVFVIGCCGCVLGSLDGTLSLKNMIDEQSFKYPKEVLKRCGTPKGNVPIIHEQIQNFDTCLQKTANITKMIEDFSTAFQDGTVQNATRHHCLKVTPVYKCVTDLVSSVERCFDDKQKEDLWMLAQIVKAVMDFVCYEDGQHVSIFLKDGGLECVIDYQEELQECTVWNDTDDFNVTSTDEIEFMRRYSFDERSCRKFLGIADCLFQKLKDCPDRTPSLLMKALTKDVFKDTPCWQYATSAAKTHNAEFFSGLFIAVILTRL